MAVEAEVKRIGGSTFIRLPPELARSLGLHAGEHVMIDVSRKRPTAASMAHLRGMARGRPPFTPDDRRDMWGP